MIRLLLTLALSLCAGLAFAQTASGNSPVPRIGIATMQPGEAFWERFGHNAIVVVPNDGREAISYNFGFFDLEEPGFVPRFIQGTMQYQLVALPFAQDLNQYERSGRGVSIQWLDLDEAQARALSASLIERSRPENARYTYDYFRGNCSTQVRDALDAALGGSLRKQLESRSQGNTYRSEAVRLAWPAWWMRYGFHLGLGPQADAPLARWGEAYIPMRLADSLEEAKRADGRPLVAQTQALLPHRLTPPPAELPRWKSRAFLLGIALAIGFIVLHAKLPRLAAVVAGVFWLVSVLLGTLMLYLWLFSAHWAAHANLNLLLLSPVGFLLLPDAWRLICGREPSAGFGAMLLIQAGMAALAGFLLFFPFIRQEAVEWVLLLLPLHWALLRRLAPKPADD